MGLHTDMRPRSADLFAGGGGSKWGGKLLGWKSEVYVEFNEYRQRVLRRRIEEGSFDDAPIWGDVRTFDGVPWRGRVDVLSAGFPCQPFSVAGKRRAADDARNMWPDTLRILSEIRPPIALLENVPGLTHATYERCACGYPDSAQILALRELYTGRRYGRCPLCGRPLGGDATRTVRYLATIFRELAALGYGAIWQVVAAAAVRAPHRRERLWVLAFDTDADCGRLEGLAKYHREWWARLDRERGYNALRLREALADASGGRRSHDQLQAGRNKPRFRSEKLADSEGQRCGNGVPEDDRARSREGDAPGDSSKVLADGEQGRCSGWAGKQRERGRAQSSDGSQPMAHTNHSRSQRPRRPAGTGKIREQETSCVLGSSRTGERSTRRIDWPVEPLVGRLANGVADRVDRIALLGDGQVPQQMALAWDLLSARLLRLLDETEPNGEVPHE
jgi:DNA (cytosine-5)-methyltransferase 1